MRIPNLESTLSGTLAIAASYTVLGYFLPHHVLRLNTLYPRLTIHLHELNRESIEEGLIAGRYDMAVLLTSNVSNPALVLEPVIHSVRRLWVGAHHPLLRHESVTFAEVAREPFVMLTVDEAGQTALRYWNETPYRPNVILRTSSVEAVRSMVANGSGVAIPSDMVYRPWSLEGRRIETIVLRDPVPPMSVGLAWRKDIELSPAMHAVRDYFRHTFMEPRALGSRLRGDAREKAGTYPGFFMWRTNSPCAPLTRSPSSRPHRSNGSRGVRTARGPSATAGCSSSAAGRRRTSSSRRRAHSACSPSSSCSRPADRRTTAFGIVIRATAIVRTNSNGSSGAVPSSGVPSIATRLLIGTESGYGFRFASCEIRPARSRRDSPMPMMPPQHVDARVTHAVERVEAIPEVRVEITLP